MNKGKQKESEIGFPIFLVAPQKEWDIWYTEEAERIESSLPFGTIKRVSHIGSTAIPNIWAKNIVDILLEVASEDDLDNTKNILIGKGWAYMSQVSKGISLKKGYTESSFSPKVFHLHLRIEGDNDELYFRDYMRANRELAIQYEQLKMNLWKEFERDREAYTEGKSEFIKKYTEIAKEKFQGRY